MAKKVAAKPKSQRKAPLDLNSRKAKKVRGMANVASLPKPVAKGKKKKSNPKKATKKGTGTKKAAKRPAVKRTSGTQKSRPITRKKLVRAKASSHPPAIVAPEEATSEVEPAKLAKAFGRRKAPSRIGTFTPGGMIDRIGD